jgi:hypothetical protein
MTTTDTEAKKYNGWTNYETWAVALWMDNSQCDQEYWNEQAEEAYREAKADDTFSRVENAAFTLRDSIKESFEENSPCQDASVYTDLLNAALGEVNWFEIASNRVDGIKEDIDKEESEETADDDDE